VIKFVFGKLSKMDSVHAFFSLGNENTLFNGTAERSVKSLEKYYRIWWQSFLPSDSL